MRLNADELLELKEQKPVKCWRLLEPTTAEAGKSYSSAGVEYTVLAKDAVAPAEMMRAFGRAEYERLRDEHGRHWHQLWLIVLVHGDRTDGLRLLAPSGSAGGDYTQLPSRAMPEEPESIDFVSLDAMAKAALPDKEKRAERRRSKQTKRSRRYFQKKGAR